MAFNYKKLLSLTLLTIIVAAFAYYIYSHINDFKALKLSNPLLIIPLIILSLIGAYTNGLVIKYLVEPFRIKMKFKEYFGLAAITSFYNIIFPFRGGLIAKAAYLKTKHKFSITHFIAMMVGVMIISILASSFLGIITLLLIYLQSGVFNAIVLILFILAFLVSLFIVIFSPKLRETKYNLANKAIQVINGWHTIKNNRKIVIAVSIITLIQIILSTAGIMLSYRVFGIHLTIVKALFLTSVLPLTIILGITPAGLGVNEAIGVFSGLVIGIAPAQSLSAAVLGRIIGTIIIFILGPIFSYLLIKHKPKKEVEKDKRIA